MNLYSYNGATPVSAAPPASSSVAAFKPTIPSNWATLGCYSDSNGQRALSAFFNAPSNGIAVERCINICSTNTGCNMACSGNAGETCGGPNRLNVYAAGGEWVQNGCSLAASLTSHTHAH